MRFYFPPLALVLFTCLPVLATPQTISQEPIQRRLEVATHQTTQMQHIFGSVEALWQFKTRKFKHGSYVKTAYTRTHTDAIISGNFVFFRITPWFEIGGFAKQPKLVELTFTALDGTKVILEPSYRTIKRQWGFSTVQDNLR